MNAERLEILVREYRRDTADVNDKVGQLRGGTSGVFIIAEVAILQRKLAGKIRRLLSALEEGGVLDLFSESEGIAETRTLLGKLDEAVTIATTQVTKNYGGGNTYLHSAAVYPETGSEVKSAIALGADPKATNEKSLTPLVVATMQGEESVVRALLEAGADANQRDEKQYMALPFACVVEKLDPMVVGSILRAGADDTAEVGIALTPMSLLAKYSSDKRGYRQVQQLLSRAATLRDYGWLAKLCNREITHIDMEAKTRKEMKELLTAFIDGDVKTPPLCTAATKGNAGLVMALLDNFGADKNFKDNVGETPLMKAADKGHLPVVEALLDAGVDVAITTDQSISALHLAAAKGSGGIVDALLKSGAAKDARDDEGATPLLFAAAEGHLPVVNALLDGGADMEARDESGDTPLTGAITMGHLPVVNALLDGGADKEARDEIGDTPLMLATTVGHLPVVNASLDGGADKEARDNIGDTPLFHATMAGHLPVVNALLDRGADKEARDDFGKTPLLQAVDVGHLPVVNVLLDRGADKEARDDFGKTPLLHAIIAGHLPVVECLLATGCDRTVRSKNKQLIVLHVAASLNSVEHVSLLLQWGADETALDRDGKTPADLIDESRPQHEAVRLLLARAPADRAWRRRGWLVMVFSRTPKAGGSGGSSGDGGATGARSVKQQCGARGGKESFDLFAAVAQLRVVEEGVFRNVVGFL
ncbi:inversin protein alternative isoform [Ectocarpus siliculosus]|uniref:Inversin protein alternative isoform n=1 Tax=Ectocarpus siliculosus TaxID=2880 RepID=D7G316_ECTSI|nr:inversin protein alternative isoform [Ectocarpus siliculosus]|eukprot:CBJ33459.1 inversin protein alternative isoform [Ectocarpus siliculosus]